VLCDITLASIYVIAYTHMRTSFQYNLSFQSLLLTVPGQVLSGKMTTYVTIAEEQAKLLKGQLDTIRKFENKYDFQALR
jgi:hypothetical protein